MNKILNSNDIIYFKCNHAFHKPCYFEWIKYSTYDTLICIICRKNISNKINSKNNVKVYIYKKFYYKNIKFNNNLLEYIFDNFINNYFIDNNFVNNYFIDNNFVNNNFINNNSIDNSLTL